MSDFYEMIYIVEGDKIIIEVEHKSCLFRDDGICTLRDARLNDPNYVLWCNSGSRTVPDDCPLKKGDVMVRLKYK